MTPRWLRFPMVALALATGLVLTVQGQEPKPKPAAVSPPKVEEKPAPVSQHGPEYDEEVIRTREDLENIQLWINAKQAQLKAAEFELQVEHKIKGEFDRLAKKGLSSPLKRDVSDLESLETNSQSALIRAEIGDLQARYNRTKRYLARLEQYGTSAMKSQEDHTLELTELQTRMKYAERMIVKLQEELKDTKIDLENTRRRQNGQ
jgi:chromosome segregation ATPase